MNPTLEIIAPTVEEAIAKGLNELGLKAEDVEVEVLDGGARGLFGLGTRQARIRLIVTKQTEAAEDDFLMDDEAEEEAAQAVKEAPASVKPTAPAVVSSAAVASKTAAPAPAPTPEKAKSPAVVPPAPPAAPVAKAAPAAPPPPAAEPESVDEETSDDVLRVSADVVRELLDKMGVTANVTAHYGSPDDPKDRIPILVDIQGDDLSILIGKRAETLNALQYIAGLIIGKELGRSLPLLVDVEGYRSRRANQLRQLARRMADQVAKTGRRLALEPMPASERRLVHIELRNHPDVTTQSVGEEPHRKVTILPKE